MRPKDIGTAFETTVVRYLRANGYPSAERRALAGIHDLGDITGTPGIAWECKGGKAAHKASDHQVALWLAETERERTAAAADLGVLVMDRPGIGRTRTGQAWAILRADALPEPFLDPMGFAAAGHAPIRVHLATAITLLRALGYGQPLTGPEAP